MPFTNGMEYQFEVSKKPYKGIYCFGPKGLTWTGDEYIFNVSKKLIKIKKILEISDYSEYDELNSRFSRKLFNFKTYSFIPDLIDEDYENGKIERFFIKQKNDYKSNIIEVDENTFDDVIEDPFYKGVSIDWYITGPIDNVKNKKTNNIRLGVKTLNRQSVSKGELELNRLSEYLVDLKQFHKRNYCDIKYVFADKQLSLTQKYFIKYKKLGLDVVPLDENLQLIDRKSNILKKPYIDKDFSYHDFNNNNNIGIKTGVTRKDLEKFLMAIKITTIWNNNQIYHKSKYIPFWSDEVSSTIIKKHFNYGNKIILISLLGKGSYIPIDIYDKNQFNIFLDDIKIDDKISPFSKENNFIFGNESWIPFIKKEDIDNVLLTLSGNIRFSNSLKYKQKSRNSLLYTGKSYLKKEKISNIKLTDPSKKELEKHIDIYKICGLTTLPIKHRSKELKNYKFTANYYYNYYKSFDKLLHLLDWIDNKNSNSFQKNDWADGENIALKTGTETEKGKYYNVIDIDSNNSLYSKIILNYITNYFGWNKKELIYQYTPHNGIHIMFLSNNYFQKPIEKINLKDKKNKRILNLHLLGKNFYQMVAPSIIDKKKYKLIGNPAYLPYINWNKYIDMKENFKKNGLTILDKEINRLYDIKNKETEDDVKKEMLEIIKNTQEAERENKQKNIDKSKENLNITESCNLIYGCGRNIVKEYWDEQIYRENAQKELIDSCIISNSRLKNIMINLEKLNDIIDNSYV